MNKQWRSLEDYNDSPEINNFKHREFQENASVLDDKDSRRNFIKLLGATTALAGLSGCSIRKPYYKIKPYSRKVEYNVPGKATYFASSFQINDVVNGVLVETHEGRPTKIEGNPSYPGAYGKSTVFQQSSVLDLYDPDRLKMPQLITKQSSLNEFKDWMLAKRKSLKTQPEKGLSFLIEKSMSPTFHSLVEKLRSKYPNSSFHQYEPINNDNQIQGLKELTNQYVVPKYKCDKPNIIVSFADDFLSFGPFQLEYANKFTERRDPDSKNKSLNRLYMFEDRFTATGAKADHRFPIKQTQIDSILITLLIRISKKISFDLSNYKNLVDTFVPSTYVDNKVLNAIVDDLLKNRSESLITVGKQLSPLSHQLAFLLNSILGNNSITVDYVDVPFREFDYTIESSKKSVENLLSSIENGQVDTLVIIGGNPSASLPKELDFSTKISKVKDRLHLTTLFNETSYLCNWVIPRLHYLESWNDFQSFDKVFSIGQPVIKRTVDGLTDNELLNLFLASYKSDFSLIKKYWGALSDNKFQDSLHNGYIFKQKSTSRKLSTNSIKFNSTTYNPEALDISLFSDDKVYDGRFSNNGWLQELPDVIHKLTWDNAAFIAPKTAKKLKLKTGDIINIQVGDQQLEIPVFEAPGHAFNVISIPVGYGKKSGLKISDGVGQNAYLLMDSSFSNYRSKATITKTKKKYEFASTQNHSFMEGRPHIRYATLTEYKHHPNFANDMVHVPADKSLWKDHDFSKGYQWGMAIDLNKCISCNACIVSCQAENNIPIVGKEEVKNGREMHWLRTDRYYEGDIDNPKLVDQPVACINCENAPCEQVCPVAATVHDDEGLNVMVYNRCVGTRYCSDNCPVKVRRFNFFDYHQRNPHSIKKDRFHLFDYMREPDKQMAKQFNPDVTVRMRGVMEKCTYCIQRIKSATQSAKNEGREIKDGEVVTACQQACPTDGISFGNILDKNSKVFKQKQKQRNYSILEQLLLKARTTYLAMVLNPNPDLEDPFFENLNHDHNHKEHHDSHN